MAEMIYRCARRRELSILPWSSAIAGAWLAGLPPSVRDLSMHLKLPDGTLVGGDAVLIATLTHVRGLKWVAWLGRHVPWAGSFVAWQYRFVARHREAFSRLVPDRPPVMREPGVR